MASDSIQLSQNHIDEAGKKLMEQHNLKTPEELHAYALKLLPEDVQPVYLQLVQHVQDSDAIKKTQITIIYIIIGLGVAGLASAAGIVLSSM